MNTFDWHRDNSWHDAHAEHAFVGAYELVAFDVPQDSMGDRMIGWELFTGRKFLDQIARGDAAPLAEAKAAAEAAYASAAGAA